MKTRNHFLLASICIILWLTFYLVGRPYNYFQAFSNLTLVLLLLITFFAIIPLVSIIILTFVKHPFLRTSVWLAFYASVPLFILDYIFVGIIEGEGFHFLISHWYLTVGYLMVWIELPIIGKTLEHLSIKVFNQNV